MGTISKLFDPIRPIKVYFEDFFAKVSSNWTYFNWLGDIVKYFGHFFVAYERTFTKFDKLLVKVLPTFASRPCRCLHTQYPFRPKQCCGPWVLIFTQNIGPYPPVWGGMEIPFICHLGKYFMMRNSWVIVNYVVF